MDQQAQADIQLAQRQYNKILKDIEQLQETKKSAFEEYKTELEKSNSLVKQNEKYIQRGKELQILIRMYQNSLEDIKKEYVTNKDLLDDTLRQLTERRKDLQAIRENLDKDR